MEPKAPFADCANCPLRDQPIVYGTGAENPKLVIVGDAPVRMGLKKKKPFGGDAGRLLATTLTNAGINTDQVYATNAVLCWPGAETVADKRTGKNRSVDKKAPIEAVRCCNKRLLAEISAKQPQAVLSVGAGAAGSLLNLTEPKITKIRGKRETHAQLHVPVMYTVHPLYCLYNKEAMRDFRADVERTLEDQRGNLQPTNKIVINNLIELKTLLLAKQTAQMCAYDLETEDLDAYSGKEIICLGLCFEPGTAYIVRDKVLKLPLARRLLNEFFAQRETIFIGNNLKFDNKWLKQARFKTPEQYEDTMLLHYAIDERRGTHGLKEQSREYLGAEDWETAVKQFTTPANRKTTAQPVQLPNGLVQKQTLFERMGYRVIPEPVLFEYAARDVDMNLQLYTALQPELDKEPQARALYKNILLPSSLMLERMEHRGLRIDRPLLDQAIADDEQESAKLESLMKGAANSVVFNPGSPAQLATFLYEDLKLPKVKFTAKGAPSTDGEALDILQSLHPELEFLQWLQDWRAVNKVLGTYLKPILMSLDKNGYTHTSIMVHGTVSGRFSERRWLLIPSVDKNKYSHVVRKLLIADDGYMLIDSDYSQAELRVLCNEAREEMLRQGFLQGDDPHSVTTDALFGTSWRDLPDKKEYRRKGKTVNFAIVYQAGPTSAAFRNAGIGPEEAMRHLQRIREGMPAVMLYIDGKLEEVNNTGRVETPFGYVRRFELITPENWFEVKREAVNFPIQSIANTLNTYSAIQIERELPGVQLKLLCHDNIICQAPENQAKELAIRVKEIMESVPKEYYTDYVPFVADCETKFRWADHGESVAA